MGSFMCIVVSNKAFASASLKSVTLKTVYLLAFATTRPRSELHALPVVKGFLRFNQFILCQPGFLAKNQLPTVLPEPITVPSLSANCSPSNLDRVLCHVRALKFYFKSQGFLGTQKAVVSTSAATISEQHLFLAGFHFLLSQLIQIISFCMRLEPCLLAGPFLTMFHQRTYVAKRSGSFSSFYLCSFSLQSKNLFIWVHLWILREL